MRIKRDTMPSYSRSWIKGHEAERFRRSSLNDFPGVYAERVAETRHLVGHPDVDRPESVLQKLGGFGHARRRDWENVFNDLRVEMRCRFGRSFGRAANHFRDVMRLKLWVAGINSFRGEGQKEILVEMQARLFKHR